MLKHLEIKNYALIKELEFDPSEKLNTITGETGAGKSIMLGAIGLLLGNRADTKALLNPNEKCVVEGVFNVEEYNLKEVFTNLELDYANECIIRREISPSGKSRAFVNDTPVTLETVKEIGSYLIDIHSQSDTLLLSKTNFQLRLIDAFSGNIDLLDEYQKIYRKYRKELARFQELTDEANEIKNEADYNQFLFDELEKADLTDNEQEELEQEQKLLEHAEEIKRKLVESLSLASESEFSILSSLQTLAKNLGQISEYSQNYKHLYQRIESVLIELKDISHELEGEEGRIEYDQSKQVEITERLSLIYKLEQKHQVSSVSELIKIKDQLEEKLHVISNIDAEVKRVKKNCDDLFELVKELAGKLSDNRKSSFEQLRNKLKILLTELGMPHSAIEFHYKEVEPAIMGIDDIKVLFSANLGIKPEELKKVASGGEFSRLMFALKNVIAESTSLPTVIFDEIDSGISGEIALKMAQLMKKMSERHQVITITHLPQIASKGNYHFFVFKDESDSISVSKIRKLEQEDRIVEIAKMIGGDQLTQTNLNAAKELLAL